MIHCQVCDDAGECELDILSIGELTFCSSCAKKLKSDSVRLICTSEKKLQKVKALIAAPYIDIATSMATTKEYVAAIRALHFILLTEAELQVRSRCQLCLTNPWIYVFCSDRNHYVCNTCIDIGYILWRTRCCICHENSSKHLGVRSTILVNVLYFCGEQCMRLYDSVAEPINVVKGCRMCHLDAIHVCKGCESVGYCSIRCQRLDFLAHREQCTPVLSVLFTN